LTNGNNHVIIASNAGRAITFQEADVRPMGRMASGVRGIRLLEGQFVVGMVCVDQNDPGTLLVVSEKGYGKRSLLEDYRITKRGGKGVKTMNVTDKTGALVAINEVFDGDDLMIINRSGIAIRMGVNSLRVMGRATQGVRLIRLNENDSISAIEVVSNLVVDVLPEGEENTNPDGEESAEGNVD
jgi:DNA gyrase subunit A